MTDKELIERLEANEAALADKCGWVAEPQASLEACTDFDETLNFTADSLSRAADRLRSLVEENERLTSDVDRCRKALIDTGRNTGAYLADDVSTDFLMHVPEEVRLRLSLLHKGDGLGKEEGYGLPGSSSTADAAREADASTLVPKQVQP